MIADELAVAVAVESLHDDGADPGFAAVRRAVEPADDSALADLIETDGRVRLGLRRAVPLCRYLEAVEDLPARPEPLDAAIDMALRAMALSPDGDGAPPVDRLAAEHPDLAPAIRDAAALGSAIWSTRRLRRHVLDATPIRPLPCAFGPAGADGHPRYELTSLLGEGAFGQVYRAVDRRLSEPGHDAVVAIKVLTAGARDDFERRTLVEEATKARRIDHPHVVRVVDLGETDQREVYVVYEHVDGGDLARWARRRGVPRPPREAAELAARIARGVHAAHMAGLVHCDLKPANIMMTRDAQPKVADFGIAARRDRDGSGSDDDEAAPHLGNIAFISPEQFRMEPGARTVPSDVYALGGLLYWLLTGALPNGETAAEIARTHDAAAGPRAAPSPRTRNDRLDVDLDAIVRRALDPDPARRHPSAAGLADDLETWGRREPLPWTHPSLARRLRLWARRKPALAAAVALIVVLLVTGAAVGRHLAREAELRRLDAAVAAARLEIETQKREQFRRTIRDFGVQMRAMRDAGAMHDLLPQIWLMEWLYGPTVLTPDGSDPAALWSLRRETVAALVDRHRTAGHDDDVKTLLWESALVFWLVRDDEDLDAAATLLERNAGAWRQHLAPDDPFLADLDALAAVIAVRRGADLAAATARLEVTQARLGARERGTPMHRLVLAALLEAYGPDRLDDAARSATIAEALRAATK